MTGSDYWIYWSWALGGEDPFAELFWGQALDLLLGRFVGPIDVTWDQLSQGLMLTEKTAELAASCSGHLADTN